MKSVNQSRIIQLISTGTLLSLSVFSAEAALVSRAAGAMVYDTDLNITWVADANLFNTQVASDPNLVHTIIANVGSVADSYYGSYSLTDYDFLNGGLTWWGAKAWAANLNYGGYSDWRLPTTPNTANLGYNQTDSELGHLFYNELGGTAGNSIITNHNANYNLFNNIDSPFLLAGLLYWSDSEYASDLATAWQFSHRGDLFNNNKSYHWSAWAVRTGDVAAVPVPSAVWLFVSGLLGLRCLRNLKLRLFADRSE